MTDETPKKKSKKKFYPKNKERATRVPKTPAKPISEQLKELQAFINSQYHTP